MGVSYESPCFFLAGLSNIPAEFLPVWLAIFVVFAVFWVVSGGGERRLIDKKT
jgi:hypothetical protein